MNPVDAIDAGEGGDPAEAVAVAAEKRWGVVVSLIILMLLAMMVVTGLHWSGMPAAAVETVDPRTLHIAGEFVDSNLGTSLDADGRPVVRLIAQQYSFEPQCIVVPADMPVTFRATSTDALHGFVIGGSNANVMLVPGFVTSFTTTFATPGERLMPCHEFCGTGHEAMWAHVQVIPPKDFLAQASSAKRLSCVPR